MGELDDLDVAAQILCDLGSVLTDGHVAVLDELLIDQAVLLEVLLDLALDHLLLDSVGLVGVLRVVGHLSEENLLLLGDDLSGDSSLIDVAGVGSCDLHGNILAVCSKLVLGLDAVGGLEVDQDAVGAAAVDVCRADALVTDETADLDVLLDDQDEVLQSLIDGLAALGLACHQSLDISGVLLHDDLGGLLDEGNELVVLGDEVGLGVDLDDDAHLALGAVISVDHALGSHAACLLGGGSQTTLTQDLDRLLEVAVSLGQSLLALHHAAVGLLAQFHNVLCSNSHFGILPYTVFVGL